MIFNISSPKEIIMGLGEMVSPLASKAYVFVRGLGIVRAAAGMLSLITNPTQIFPENKFHDDHDKKQDYF